MKTFTATLLAAALAVPALAAPAMAQPPQHHEQQPQTHGKEVSKAARQPGYKTFRKGDKFDRSRARNYQVVDYRHYKKLPAPKKGYRYVRAGGDVLLIGTSSLKVYAVYSGLIR